MPVEFKDYYKTLGVARTAEQEEIRKAFRKLARQYHPDVAKDKKRAEEKFKEINEAYEVLGDAEKRKKYDTLGANWNRPQPPPGWQGGAGAGRGGWQEAPDGEEFEFRFGGTGFSDFFEQFFGGRANGKGFENLSEAFRHGRTGGAARGQDIAGDILVNLDEVAKGSIRTVSFERVNRHTGKTVSENFRVRVPVGVREGQTIRIAGKGEEGANGGASGDLLLRVRLAQHPDFQVNGSDLSYELELAPWEAVLGTTVSIPTLEGAVSVRVPPGANPGQRLRVRGKGLPGKGETHGDLYVAISLRMPTELDDKERILWEQLAKHSKFNPRT